MHVWMYLYIRASDAADIDAMSNQVQMRVEACSICTLSTQCAHMLRTFTFRRPVAAAACSLCSCQSCKGLFALSCETPAYNSNMMVKLHGCYEQAEKCSRT